MSPLGKNSLEYRHKDKRYTFEFQVTEQNACEILARESKEKGDTSTDIQSSFEDLLCSGSYASDSSSQEEN
ncbi:hypothetical protein QQF64_016980 [Cirrhinus molitorella]|uniref:Uncharacterized protein n=1 Tax=Cirrhinus molitorella TaxID=172907 RepID=A0ABR3LPC7_9TELE